MAVDKESIKKMFPNLFKELETGDAKVSIDALRKNPEEAEADIVECAEQEIEEVEFETATKTPDKLRHFNPSAEDFIRRCDTQEQANEIIDYLEKKGELTEKCAQEMRCKLKKEGVRSFGPKKEENHYFREGGIF
ncbi:MAG: DUF2095 family protein [Candidatus Bathyarchaeia archaeon]